MTFRMSPGRGCCPVCSACQIGYDQFNRGDSTDLGDDWVEVAGDWETLDESLSTLDSLALALHQGPPPSGPPRHYVEAKVFAELGGDVARVFVATDSLDYGLWAELTFEEDDQCGKLSLWKAAGGTATKLAEQVVPNLTAGDWHGVQVCFRPASPGQAAQLGAVVTTRDGSQRATAVETTSVGSLAGLGTGATSGRVRFDDFCWQRHYNAAAYSTGYVDVPADPNCPQCGLPTCTFARDDFARAALGCMWNVNGGDWTIADETLHAATAGTLVSTFTHPSGSSQMVLSGSLTLPTIGDKVRVYVAWEDAANWIAAEFEAVSDTCGTITILRSHAGNKTVESAVVSAGALAAGATTDWFLCLGHRTAGDSATYAVAGAGSAAATSWGTLGGLGSHVALSVETVVGSPIIFDDIAVSYTLSEATPTCRACFGWLSCAWATVGGGTGSGCEWDLTGTWDSWAVTSSSGATATTKTANPSGFDMLAVLAVTFHGPGDSLAISLAGGAVIGTVTAGDGCLSLTISDGTSSASIVADVGNGLAAAVVVSYVGGSAWIGCLYPGSSVLPPSASLYRSIAIGAGVSPPSAHAGITVTTASGPVTISGAFYRQSFENSDCHRFGSCLSAGVREPGTGTCLIESHTSSGNISSWPLVFGGSGEYALINGGGVQGDYVAVKLRFTATNQRARVRIKNDDGGAGPWAELELTPTGGWFRLSDGQQAAVNSLSTSGFHTVVLCWRGGTLTANLDQALGLIPPLTASLTASGLAASGNWFGVSDHSATAGVEFLEVVGGATRHPLTGERCGTCYTLCDCAQNDIAPAEMLAEVEGYDFDGLGIEAACACMSAAFYLRQASKCAWSYVEYDDICGICQTLGHLPPSPGGIIRFDFYLWCWADHLNLRQRCDDSPGAPYLYPLLGLNYDEWPADHAVLFAQLSWGWVGSQANCDVRELATWRSAPLAEPVNLATMSRLLMTPINPDLSLPTDATCHARYPGRFAMGYLSGRENQHCVNRLAWNWNGQVIPVRNLANMKLYMSAG